MKQFYADLHLHPKILFNTEYKKIFSHLGAWAKLKGIPLLATGDFIHPQSLEKICAELVESDGFLMLKKGINNNQHQLPFYTVYLSIDTKFILQSEIKLEFTIEGEKRHLHLIIYVSSLETAKNLSKKLCLFHPFKQNSFLPTLSISPQTFLDMLFETDPLAMVIPAHVFERKNSLFGEENNFSSFEECFKKFTANIFAVEVSPSSSTHLASLCKQLKNVHTIVASGASSGFQIGRSCLAFNETITSYAELHKILSQRSEINPFQTIEYPCALGKNYLDGHRQCHFSQLPQIDGEPATCPICNETLQRGSLSRIYQLAQKNNSSTIPQPATPIISLFEILAEITGLGIFAPTLYKNYYLLAQYFGGEIPFLLHTPIADIKEISEPLAEAVLRIRKQTFVVQHGYDSIQGQVQIFSEQEREEIQKDPKNFTEMLSSTPILLTNPVDISQDTNLLLTEPLPELLSDEQEDFINSIYSPAFIYGFTGSGKTLCLVYKVARLITQDFSSDKILVLMPNLRASGIFSKKLISVLGEYADLPATETLLSLAHTAWKSVQGGTSIYLNTDEAFTVFCEANNTYSHEEILYFWNKINERRAAHQTIDSSLEQAYASYATQKISWDLLDFWDIMEFYLEHLQTVNIPYSFVFVDDLENYSLLELKIIKTLAVTEGFFAAASKEFDIFSKQSTVRAHILQFWERGKFFDFKQNLRCANTIQTCANTLLPKGNTLKQTIDPSFSPQEQGNASITLFSAQNEEQEYLDICKNIQNLFHKSDKIDKSDETDENNKKKENNPKEYEKHLAEHIAIFLPNNSRIKALTNVLDLHNIAHIIPEHEFFWKNPHIQMILQTVGSLFGYNAYMENMEFPNELLLKGPTSLPENFTENESFSTDFFLGAQFQQLCIAYERQQGWKGLLSWIHQQENTDAPCNTKGKIQIYTYENALDLEFKTIFLPALEEKNIPKENARKNISLKDTLYGIEHAEREKKLFYTLLTRAKRNIFLSFTKRRLLHGQILITAPAPFLHDLPKELVSVHENSLFFDIPQLPHKNIQNLAADLIRFEK